MKCRKCGGEKIGATCNLCVLFASAQAGEPMACSGGHRPKCWPQISTKALAVAPDQVADANARNRLHGVPVEYNAQGHAIIPDNGARRKLLALEGMHDNDSFI